MDNGGPAFPSVQMSWSIPSGLLKKYPELEKELVTQQYQMNGISLRDYFAAKALSLGGEFFHNLGNGCDTAETVSIAAYQIADAMIATRKKVAE